MPGAYDYSDLMVPEEPKTNLVASLGLSQYPIASIAAWLALSIGEKRFTDAKHFSGAFQQMGMRRWQANGIIRGQMGGPLSAAQAQSVGAGQVQSFMRKHGWKDLHEMSREMTPRSFNPTLKRNAFRFNGGGADRALYSGLERRFGKKFATRMMVGRALGSISSAANMFFLAEIGGMAGNFVGNMILNWRPAEGKPDPRRTLETGGNWVDTRIAFTQRQRAIQAIHNSMLTSRAALGNEASFMHG